MKGCNLSNDLELAKAFEDDKLFRALLRDPTFNDYLNIFLSLPVFAIRMFYRRDNGVFEVEPPISRRTHHIINDKVVSWVRLYRGNIFLETTIFNEYLLCAALLELPVRLKIEGFGKHQIETFQRKYLSKVIDMQRLKSYMEGSIGECLMMFWLDAERFKRHVPDICRRFVLKEMYAKYLKDGAMYELNYTLKEKIKSYLRESYDKGDECGHLKYIESSLLQHPQDIILQGLQEYWIPKYVQHRLQRRSLIKKRWGKVLRNPAKQRDVKEKPKLLMLVNELQYKIESIDSKDLEERLDSKLSVLSDAISSPGYSDNKIASSNEDAGEDRISRSRAKRRRRRSKSISHSFSSSGKLPEEVVMMEDLTLNKWEPLYKRVKKIQSNLKRKEVEADDFIETQISASKLITMNSPLVTTGKHGNHVSSTSNLTTDESLLSGFLPHIYAQDKKKAREKSTFFESLYEHKDDYDADNEDPQWQKDGAPSHLQLPLIKTLNNATESFIAPLLHLPKCPSKLQTPFSKSFIKKNVLSIVPDKNKKFDILIAALITDQIAGQPLLKFFKETGHDVAESNLKFWTASNDILTDCHNNDPIMRQKQYHVLIHVHLADFSKSNISLSQSAKQELCILLPKGVGLTKLMEASNKVAVDLLPEWECFMKQDKAEFLKVTTTMKRRRGSIKDERQLSLLELTMREEIKGECRKRSVEMEDENRDIELIDEVPEPSTRANTCKRMWRAMELSISIGKPKHTNELKDTHEDEKWTTDESADEGDEEDSKDLKDESIAGSLSIRTDFMHKKIERITRLKELFNKRHLSLVHEYTGVSLLTNISADDKPYNVDLQPLFSTHEQRTEQHAKPPRPRCFQDVLTDPIQFEHFKRFLMKEKEEIPLLFWSAVESMRTNSRSAKARQGRTHGIVKRYFGPGAMLGRDLKCNADIIKEIPFMEKVTPAMLVSAQACVSKTLEEAWFTKYLITFQDCGGVIGVSVLPSYAQGAVSGDSTRSVKQKTRGLWRMFTKNVISFRRGIMHSDTLKLFSDFLELQHYLNLEQSNCGPIENQLSVQSPPRIAVNNKLIHTEKLTADLNFWSEVERYKDFADAVVLCAKLGNYTKDDEIIVIKKARTIVDCFIDSQIAPRVQININNDLAENVIQLVQNGIIERGLFHEAALSTFSTLIYFWKKFCLHRCLPKEKMPAKYKPLRYDRSAQIVAKQKALKANKIKRITLPPDEDCSKIMFSIQLGLRLGIHKALKRKLTVVSEFGSRADSVVADSPNHHHVNSFSPHV